MSQYPVPYQPAPGGFDYYTPPGQLLAPARRAAIMLFILGGLAVLCGGCITIVVWSMPIDQMISQSGIQFPDTPGMSKTQFIRAVYTIFGVGSLLVGILTIALGVFARRGSQVGLIGGIVVAILVGIFGILDVFAGVLQALQNPAVGLVSLCTGGVLILIVVSLIVFSVQGLRAVGPARAQQAQYMAQLWHHQQQQTAFGGYGQTGITGPGYGPPPPPPPPPSNTPQ